MKSVLLSILAILIATSAHADRRDRRHHRPPHHGGIGQLPDSPHHGGYYPQIARRFITCESHASKTSLCYTGLAAVYRIDVRRQYSRAPCIAGATFGVRGNSVFTTLGCRATFVIEGPLY